jgi:hypothetical protein
VNRTSSTWRILLIFLAAFSPLEVNLPEYLQVHFRDDVFKNVVDESSRVVPVPEWSEASSVFDDAVSKILQLIMSDTFPRFLCVPKHENLWKNFLTTQEQERVLTQSDRCLTHLQSPIPKRVEN